MRGVVGMCRESRRVQTSNKSVIDVVLDDRRSLIDSSHIRSGLVHDVLLNMMHVHLVYLAMDDRLDFGYSVVADMLLHNCRTNLLLVYNMMNKCMHAHTFPLSLRVLLPLQVVPGNSK
jgi:hypothetical protein